MNLAPSYFYDKSKMKLWIVFRFIQALWTIQEILPAFSESTDLNAWPVLRACNLLSLVVSVIVIVSSFFSTLETKMSVLFSIWSVSCALYYLLLIGIEIKSSGYPSSRHLVLMFILPLWSSLHRTPLLILWLQQIATFFVVLSGSYLGKNWSFYFEQWAMLGFLTIIGMFIVYTYEAAGCFLVEGLSNHNMDLESIISLRETVSKKEDQVKEERDMTLFLSHEIRNPLFNISNALDFFGECLDSLERVTNLSELPSLIGAMHSYTSDIRIGMEHCTNLLTNILSLRKIQQGKMNWQDQYVNVKRLCQNVISLTKYMAKKGVEFRVDVPPDVWVLCDERLLSQVLVNLVANALKFTSHGFVVIRVDMSEDVNNPTWGRNVAQSFEYSQKLWISSRWSHSLSEKSCGSKHAIFPDDIDAQSPSSSCSEKRAKRPVHGIPKSMQKFVFQVCDTGPGISKEKQGMLFQKFQQTGNHFGAGIGLMLSQQIVQSKGGCINLESPSWVNEVDGSVYAGSKFTFALNLCKVNPSTQLRLQGQRDESYAEAVKLFSDSSLAESNQILGKLFGIRLLLVDDSMTNLKQLHHKFTKQAPFSQLAWSCELAQTGKAALNIFKEQFDIHKNCVLKFETNTPYSTRKESTPNAFSVLVVDSDLNLDDDELRDGMEVIRCMREVEQAAAACRKGGDFQRLLIISFSGHADDEHQKAALSAGADIVWTKPLPSATKILKDILQKLCSDGDASEHDCLTSIVQSMFEEKTLSGIPANAGRPLKRTQIIFGEDKSMKTRKYSTVTSA